MTGDQLRASRAALGLSQKAAADLIHKSWRSIQDYECGVTPIPEGVAELWSYKVAELNINE